jgi:arylsulfatase A-like enzyme
MKPNVVFVFADQWRAQACGYAGDSNVSTPHLDSFAAQSLNFVNAISGCPVCTPYRASLMTGQYPLTNGIFCNDQCLYERAPTGTTFLAEAFNAAGYDTAYIGKWHIDGHGRKDFVPPERRLGFKWWRGFECTHDYNQSFYYSDTEEKLEWEGYDAFAQTRLAGDYLRQRSKTQTPFLLGLSWGPPHEPYQTAPEQFRAMYDPASLRLRGNVPPEAERQARQDLAGYYAHCSALDACLGELLEVLSACDLAKNTIVVFTSDHGDLLGSHGAWKKQQFWAESVSVPFLVRDPLSSLPDPRQDTSLIDAPDIMPTLLGLCGIDIPDSVEGQDLSLVIRKGVPPTKDTALLQLPVPFHQYGYGNGGREWRALLTPKYVYVRDHSGPWHLFDNEADPRQLNDLINDPAYTEIRNKLDTRLRQQLRDRHDDFLPGRELLSLHKIRLNENGDVYNK